MRLETTTPKGAKVILEASTQAVFPTVAGAVAVTVTTPKGSLGFLSRKWGTMAGTEGIVGFARVDGKYQEILVAVKRQEFDAVMAAGQVLATAQHEEEEAAAVVARAKIAAVCPEGYELATKNWENGDLCAAEYLTVDGVKVVWADMQTNQGEGLYYIPTVEADKARVAKEEQAAKTAVQKAKQDAHEAAVIETARTTGQPAKLHAWTEECDDPREECNTDIVTAWIHPDGTLHTTRNHTW